MGQYYGCLVVMSRVRIYSPGISFPFSLVEHHRTIHMYMPQTPLLTVDLGLVAQVGGRAMQS